MLDNGSNIIDWNLAVMTKSDESAHPEPTCCCLNRGIKPYIHSVLHHTGEESRRMEQKAEEESWWS